MSKTSSAGRPQRPGAVWAVSIVLIVFVLLGTMPALLLLAQPPSTRSPALAGAALPVLGTVVVVVSLAQALTGFLVFRGVELGRRVALGISVVSIIAGVLTVALSGSSAGCTGILVNVVIILALGRQNVVSWCR